MVWMESRQGMQAARIQPGSNDEEAANNSSSTTVALQQELLSLRVYQGLIAQHMLRRFTVTAETKHSYTNATVNNFLSAAIQTH